MACARNTNISLQYCVHNSALCKIIADILTLLSPGSLQKLGGLVDKGPLDDRLAG